MPGGLPYIAHYDWWVHLGEAGMASRIVSEETKLNLDQPSRKVPWPAQAASLQCVILGQLVYINEMVTSNLR